MPAPSMFSRQPILPAPSTTPRNRIRRSVDETQDNRRSVRAVVASNTVYDEVFTSKPVSEMKTMLWEIKEFHEVFTNRVERAMNFEFEVGRLGSMERHLPRRSRWKVMLDVDDLGTTRIPAIRVLQLSPENKVVFYHLNVCVLERTYEAQMFVDTETDFRTPNYGYKEGQADISSEENVFPIQLNSSCVTDFLDQVQPYIYEGSLFMKVTIEILEDAST